MREGADRAGNRAGADILLRPQKPLLRTRELGIGEGELQSECRRFGVDAVAAADCDCIFVLDRAAFQRFEQGVEVRKQNVRRPRELDRKAGVEHIRRGHALVHEARLGPDMLGHARQKGDNVVLHLALDLVDAGDVERAALTQGFRGSSRDLPELLHRLGGKSFDFQPDFVSAPVGPYRRHLRPGVARDHWGARYAAAAATEGEMLKLWDCRRAESDADGVRPDVNLMMPEPRFAPTPTTWPCSASTLAMRRAMAGAGSSQMTGQGAKRIQLVEQQRVMRAAQHDDVGFGSAVIHEARRDLAADGVIVDNRAAGAHLRQFRERGRADELEASSGPKFLDQFARILACDRSWRCEDGDKPAFRERGGGLDGGDGSDDGNGESFPQSLKRDGGSCVAGKDETIRLRSRKSLLHDAEQPQDQDVLALRAVGKARIVRDEKNCASGMACRAARRTVRPPRPELIKRSRGVVP